MLEAAGGAIVPRPALRAFRFRALTAAAQRAFPGYLPYGGAHPDVVPHLTTGQGQREDLLESAARAIEPRLPVIATVRSAVVMQGSLQPGTWHVIADLPLGAM